MMEFFTDDITATPYCPSYIPKDTYYSIDNSPDFLQENTIVGLYLNENARYIYNWLWALSIEETPNYRIFHKSFFQRDILTNFGYKRIYQTATTLVAGLPKVSDLVWKTKEDLETRNGSVKFISAGTLVSILDINMFVEKEEYFTELTLESDWDEIGLDIPTMEMFQFLELC